MKSLSFLIVAVLLVASCGFNKKGSNSSLNTSESQEVNKNQSSHVVTVTDLVQATNYSYLKLKEGSQEYWAALPKFDAKIGQTYYYNKGMEMKEFKSKELNRTFSSIWFIDEMNDKPIAVKNSKALTSTGRQNVDRLPNISVKPAEGGITISGLMSDKAQFASKKIRINGQVVKFSPDIMKKNWVHLQDGTEASGEYDLVVTTNDIVKVGDIVTFEGKIATNKDIGYGYKYDVILEEAEVLK
jgi:hypothetical protein